jgi:predicted DNA-binding protein YlxM (UPF0122 family)
MEKIMEKDLTVSLLLDFYAAFLTEKQREIMDMYYNLDYSLSEVAEAQSITRQGAMDAVKRGVSKLKGMEQELKLMHKYISVSESLKKCRELANKLNDLHGNAETGILLTELDRAIGIWEDKDGI